MTKYPADTKSELGRTSKDTEVPSNTAELREKALHKRLKYASDIIERLRNAARVPKTDRPIMARNLGYMFARTIESGDDSNLSKIFREAFGDDIGSSHFKKRKRYIRLNSDIGDAEREDGWKESYVAAGRDYLALATAIESFAEKSPGLTREESIQLYVLRLIEGSSFDDRTGIIERRDIEQREELQIRLDQVIDRLVSRVDLDWFRMWCQQNHIGIEGATGTMTAASLISGSGWGDMLDIYENTEGNCYNRIAPCVRIAHVMSRHQLNGVLMLDVPRTPIEELGAESALHDVLREKLGVPPNKKLGWDEWPILSESEHWVGESDFSTFEYPQVLKFYFRRFLDIEVRYDPGVDRWRLCVLLRPEMDRIDGELDASKCFFHSPFGPQAELKCFQVGMENGSLDYIYAVRLQRRKGSDLYACFTVSSDLEIVENAPGILGVTAGCLIAVSQMGGDFLLHESKSDELRVVYEIDPCDDYYSPAPSDSIGGALLRNLAYAPVVDRIDTLLIQEAKRRYEMIRELANRSDKEYKEAISRMDAKSE